MSPKNTGHGSRRATRTIGEFNAYREQAGSFTHLAAALVAQNDRRAHRRLLRRLLRRAVERLGLAWSSLVVAGVVLSATMGGQALKRDR